MDPSIEMSHWKPFCRQTYDHHIQQFVTGDNELKKKNVAAIQSDAVDDEDDNQEQYTRRDTNANSWESKRTLKTNDNWNTRYQEENRKTWIWLNESR